MATIIERNGRFLARVRRQGFSPVSQTFHRRSDATSWARQVEADMEGGRWLNASEKVAAPTLRQAVATYQAGAAKALKGAVTYAYWLNEVAMLPMASKPINAVSSADIACWRDEMAQTLKPGTIVRKLGMLSGLFTWAQKDCGWIDANPVRQVRKPRVRDGRDRIISAEELQFIHSAASASKADWLADSLVILQTSAMRRGEVWALRTTDIELATSVAHLSDTKNGSARDVPLCPRARDALRNLVEQANRDGRQRLLPVSSAHAVSLAFRRVLLKARRAYQKACHDAGDRPATDFLADLRLHDFRHHAVSHWASTGALSLMELMAISGHKNPRMLARYTHLSAPVLASKLSGLPPSL